MWTFQEIALSKKAQILCGANSASWQQFIAGYSTILFSDNALLAGQESHLRDTNQILLQTLIQANLWINKNESAQDLPSTGSPDDKQSLTLNLLSLVRTLRKNGASNPRDKIYGLLGIANDLDDQLPVISYKDHFMLTYAAFARWFINRHRDLAVLKLVNIGVPAPEPLPSWIPDFRTVNYMNNLRTEEGSGLLPHGPDRLYGATGSSVAQVEPGTTLELQLSGVCIGTITSLSDPAGNLIGNVAIGPRVLDGGQWPQMAQQCAVDGVYPPTREPIQQAYERLRVGDEILDEQNVPYSWPRRSKLALPIPAVGSATYLSSGDGRVHAERGDISRQITKHTTRQRFYITDTGYMGLAHRSCLKGDKVYLLMGGDMPFVLRHLQGVEGRQKTFQFKGESYVHGVMDGEHLVGLLRSAGRDASHVGDAELLASLSDSVAQLELETVTLR